MRTPIFLAVTLLLLTLLFPACHEKKAENPPSDGDMTEDEHPDGDDPTDGDADGDTNEDGDLDDDADADTDDDADGDRDSEGDEETDSEEETDGETEPDWALDEETLVMTFNLRTGTASDGDHSWTNRKPIVAELITQHRPAVLGVQEAWKFQLDYIKENVPDMEWVGISRKNTVFEEYCAVFFRTDLFTLVNSETFWLSDTPEVPQSTFSPNQKFPRIVTWAELKSRVTGRRLFVFNTHFDNTSVDNIPEKSAALLARKIAEIAGDAPALVTGDFNELVTSDAYRILTGEIEFEGARGELIDPWVVLELPEEGTYHGFTGVANHASRIDWILATAHFEPLSAQVLHDETDGIFPSDHFPVIAKFWW